MRLYFTGVLPHWRQPGCTYFVTFRLNDSIPLGIVREIEYERHQWLQHRGIDPSEKEWMQLLIKSPKTDLLAYQRFVTDQSFSYSFKNPTNSRRCCCSSANNVMHKSCVTKS